MNLYRIILVDDEEEVRKGIIKKISWEALGFQVVGDAENGKDALEKMEQLEVDVVMTDIRMPYMDGLTLTSEIRRKYPSTKVLIFSGFDDFEYAQQAIKLNVAEYILKPVNVEELTEILERVRETLDEEIEQRRNVSLLRERYRTSLPIIRELYLNDMIRGLVGTATMEAKLQEYQVDILHAKKWITAVISIEMEMGEDNVVLSLHQEQELIPISVKQLVADHLKKYCRFTVFNSYAGIGVIAAIDEENTQIGLINQLEDICKESRRILKVSITIGIGFHCTGLDQVCKSYQAAVDALGYKGIIGTGQTICINDVEPVNRGKLQLSIKEESDLVAAVKFGPKDKIQEIVQVIVGKMGDARVHFRQYQIYMLSVLNCLTRLMQQYDLNLSNMFDTDTDYFDIVSSLQKREEFSGWLTQVACRMNDAMNQERDNTTKKVILEAKQYVQAHYQEPDLSVEKLCRHLHMSPAYFSTVFKKETGQAYIGYLTEVRLNKAVELLKETDDKTYVIAAKVGYQEQNYFSYVFKKQFGVSPTKYRGA